jgi:hypothetical protein
MTTIAKAKSVSATTWTYEGYRNTVLGTAEAVLIVPAFDRDPATRHGLDEWLGQCEAEAWSAGGLDGDMRDVWPAEYHARALDELLDAAGVLS